MTMTRPGGTNVTAMTMTRPVRAAADGGMLTKTLGFAVLLLSLALSVAGRSPEEGRAEEGRP